MFLRLNLLLIMCILLAIGLTPRQTLAQDGLSGSFLYGASQYRAEVAGEEAQRAKTQYGQVSLQFDKEGLLGDARVGKYTLMIGYEFNLLAPSLSTQGVNNPDVQRIETGKILYNGELLLAPGGLPFRLTGYARDIHRSSFQEGQQYSNDSVGYQADGMASLIETGVNSELSNGKHHELALTLLVGIRNGSYLGAYRDVLSQVPRLLIDYHQIDVNDTAQDFNIQHTRARDLAFISLNKKDNWVHLRMHDYTDYIDSTNDTEMSQVLIGTIDHLLSRQWINLTNWIKISGDLSLTNEKREDGAETSKTYNLNMFARAQRKKSKLNVLSTFERGINDDVRLVQVMDVPIYYTLDQNRDTLYRAQFRNSFDRESLLTGIADSPSTTLTRTSSALAGFSAELFRTRAIVFKPNLEFEVYNDNDVDGFAEKVNLEWSNRIGSKGVLWDVAVHVAGSQTADGTDQSAYWEKGFDGRAEKDLTRTTRIGMRVSGTSGDRSSDSVSNDAGGFINMETLQVGTTGEQFSLSEVNSFQKYIASAFLDNKGKNYDNRLECEVESITADSESLSAFSVEHVLQKRTQNKDFSLTSRILFGDNLTYQSLYFDYLSAQVEPNGLDSTWSSEAHYNYAPDRRISLVLNGGASGSFAGGANQSLSLSETFNYRFYTINGIIRKLAEISEEVGWERVSESVDGREQAIRFRLDGSIYPTKYFYSKIISEFVLFEPNSSQQLKFGAETGLDFPKAQILLSYVRGFKTEEGGLPESLEERWDVKIKKTF